MHKARTRGLSIVGISLALTLGAPALAESIDLTTYHPAHGDGSNYTPGSVQVGYTQYATTNSLTVITGPNLPAGTESTHNNFYSFPAGDFTAQVTATSTSTAVAQLYATFFSGGYAGLGYHDGSAFTGYGFGDGSISTCCTPASSPIVLRIARQGDVFTAAFSDASTGGFKTLTTLTGTNVTGEFGMDLSVYGLTGQSEPGIVVYSNFNIVETAPNDIALQGGPAEAPVSLDSGVTSVSGLIGGDAGSSNYYSFIWQGGEFSAIGNVLHAEEPNFFNYSLCAGAFCSAETKLSNIVLDVNNGWHAALNAMLASGIYTIGLSENGGPDPEFSIVFATPAATAPSPLPESSTWATMIMGFAFIGGSVRRRRSSVAVDSADQRPAGL